MIAEIILNSSAKELNKTFDYNIPSNLEGIIHIGSRVFVPFGNSKRLEEGFVIGFKEKTEYKIKDIKKVEESLLTEKNIELAKLMARRYFCNVFDCIKLMLPPGMSTRKFENRIKSKKLNCVYLAKEYEEIEFDIESKKIKNDKQIRILNVLRDNSGITVADLQIIADSGMSSIKTLEKNEYIKIVSEIIERNPFENKNIKKTKPFKFTNEQQVAFDKINSGIENNIYGEYLIYGITGSRKNRDIFTAHTKCIK